MGINAGAFLGILLCGYLGEKVGWHWGFGLAGIFMFFGMLQFYFAQSIFGSIGLKPEVKKESISTIIINSIKGLWDSLIYGINNAPKALYLIVGVLALAGFSRRRTDSAGSYGGISEKCQHVEIKLTLSSVGGRMEYRSSQRLSSDIQSLEHRCSQRWSFQKE